jgi:SAM-dependent methyltransferase
MTPTASYPEPNVIRFVRRFFPKPRVLDIGSGSGNHSRLFRKEGWHVTSVDRDHDNKYSHVHYRADIRECDFTTSSFDLVLDHNTLCHVEDAPYSKIHRWTKNVFKCVHPTDETWPGVGVGKSYTRFASEHDLRESLKPFRDVKVWRSSYPDFKDHEISSWVAWGWK